MQHDRLADKRNPACQVGKNGSVATDHLLAGHLVASRAVRQDWQDVGLLSADVVSMSECIVDLVSADRDGWDDWFADPASAEQARTHAGRSGLHVLAVGIAVPDVPALLKDMARGGYDQEAGGLRGRLARREFLPGIRSGEVLGFELVGFDTGSWHTWTCLGGLVKDVRQATSVRPERWGLIPDEQEARRAAAWLTASELGDPKVLFWVPALLVDVSGRGNSAREE
jgi:hypothetical protein